MTTRVIPPYYFFLRTPQRFAASPSHPVLRRTGARRGPRLALHSRDARRSFRAQPARALCVQRAAGLDLGQQTFNLILFFKRGKTIVERIAVQLGMGLANGFCALHFVLHAIESTSVGAILQRSMCLASFLRGAGAAVLRDQQVALGLCLR